VSGSLSLASVQSLRRIRLFPTSVFKEQHLKWITRDTFLSMGDVSIRELRNHGGNVIDRAASGEVITVTRSGKRVAELKPLQSGGLSTEVAISRRRLLPRVDHDLLRADIDQVLDPSI